MGWHFKNPQAFPAFYFEAIRIAYQTNESTVLGSFPILRQAKTLAESFRWFRWCIKQEPGTNQELFHILATCEVRTSIKSDQFGYIVWLSIQPSKISDFVKNNPKLAEEVMQNV